MKKILSLVAFFLVATLLTVGIVLYARGYRPNFRERTLDGTGIVSIKSQPSGATVFLNSEEKGTTDLDIPNLSPDQYRLKITKEGFSTWEKEITIKKEQVGTIEVLLFPIAPNLKALTFTGAQKPLLSPDGDQIIFAVSNGSKDGLWILPLSTRPLPIFFSRDLFQIVADTKANLFSEGKWRFSPDGNNLLVELKEGSFLLNSSERNQQPQPLSATELSNLVSSWTTEIDQTSKTAVKSLGRDAEILSATLSNVTLSPDKKRFLGTNKNGQVVVFDSDPTLLVDSKPEIYTFPKAASYLWYSDSKHLISVEENSLAVIELDGTNKAVVYTGNFASDLIVPWPDGSKIVILTNLNSTASKLPNLYAIELR